MAKFTITFENAEIKKELEFRGQKYEYTMKPFLYGMRGDGKSFYTQLMDIADGDDEFLDSLENLDFGNEEEMKDAMDYLTEIE